MDTEKNHPLPGSPPPPPTWGQETIFIGPELKKRIQVKKSAKNEAVLVLGAGGAFAPELLNALYLQGTKCIIGADIQLTYKVDHVTYRKLDLCNPNSIKAFFNQLFEFLKQNNLKLGTIYDLSTTQTSPSEDQDRNQLVHGKQALIDILCEQKQDIYYMFMSTAEVYGASKGAPYFEKSTKAPFNSYGKHKFLEEKQILAAHGRPTKKGTLKTTALRCWTISMVSVDPQGNILSTRNYNDPFVMLAQKLSHAGIKIPVVYKNIKAQFHFAEEVAEICLLLGEAPPDATTWNGEAYNCPGKEATHEQFSQACFDVFSSSCPKKPWWSIFVQMVFKFATSLPKPVFMTIVKTLELAGDLLKVRDFSGRLPFLYRSTHMDSSKIKGVFALSLSEPNGSCSVKAVERLAKGILHGGTEALNVRRFKKY